MKMIIDKQRAGGREERREGERNTKIRPCHAYIYIYIYSVYLGGLFIYAVSFSLISFEFLFKLLSCFSSSFCLAISIFFYGVDVDLVYTRTRTYVRCAHIFVYFAGTWSYLKSTSPQTERKRGITQDVR